MRPWGRGLVPHSLIQIAFADTGHNLVPDPFQVDAPAVGL